MIKKRYILLFFVILFGSIFFVVFNAPAYPTPLVPVQDTIDTSFAPEPVATKAQKDDLIVVDTPLPGALVGEPITITGRARGYRWLAMLESGEVKSLAEIARRERVFRNCFSII